MYIKRLISHKPTYTPTWGHYANPNYITYSIVPDGTVITTSPRVVSDLYAVMPTGWEQAIINAAAVWSAAANINLVQVSDDGADWSLGTSDGIIRIFGYDLGASQLGSTSLPASSPASGGDSCQISFNTTQTWQINGTYDVETVAIHEFGNALGLTDCNSDTSSVMCCYYLTCGGMQQELGQIDILDIQGIYGPKQTFDGGLFDLVIFNGGPALPYL